MIDSVIIKNFQSHKNSELEFTPGLNVIIGQTDSGKTAILRALNWVFTNRPMGDSFKSHWGGECSVKIKTNSNEISRIKGSSNSYQLNGINFTAFGTGVPDEITTALNISEINYQKQMDAPYLLNETPGAVASHFNKIANFEQIDKSISFVDKAIYQIKAKSKGISAEIETKTIQLEKYSNLEILEKELNNIKILEAKQAGYCDKINLINSLVEKYNLITPQLAKLEKQISLLPKVEELISLNAELLELRKSKKDLKNYVIQFNDIDEQKNEYQSLANLLPKVEEILALIAELAVTKIRKKLLSDTVFEATKINTEIEFLQELLPELQNEWETEFPERCPLCGK